MWDFALPINVGNFTAKQSCQDYYIDFLLHNIRRKFLLLVLHILKKQVFPFYLAINCKFFISIMCKVQWPVMAGMTPRQKKKCTFPIPDLESTQIYFFISITSTKYLQLLPMYLSNVFNRVLIRSNT